VIRLLEGLEGLLEGEHGLLDVVHLPILQIRILHLRNCGELLRQKRIEQGVERHSDGIVELQERLLELRGQLLKLSEIQLRINASLFVGRRSC
jgi:hypothetical protein